MADLRNSKATTSAASPSAATDGVARKAFQPQATGKAPAIDPRLAGGATIDEILAKEAIANMKRARVIARVEPVRTKARVIVPPATITVRTSTPPAWKAPFVSLAVIVGISIFLTAGSIAYLALQPSSAKPSEVELRNIRDSVARLRRNVAELSSDLTANRAALDVANKTASDRLVRLSQSLDRVGRDQAMQTTKAGRVAEDNAQVARAAPAELPSDVTGTLQQQPRPTNARTDIISDWHVRRAYDGLAILEGQSGVIEVNLGQDVPNLGRIQEIKYENGRWQVLTSKGLILPAR